MRTSVVCINPVPTFDDSFHVDISRPMPGTCLDSHPLFAGSAKYNCEYRIKELGSIVVPGLHESIFQSTPKTLYMAGGKKTPLKVIRIPSIHVLMNQGLKASQRGVDYDWNRLISAVEEELLAITAQTIDKKAMRAHEGNGFMALAQGNPNQGRDCFVVGVDMAKKLLPSLMRRDSNIKSISDLNGLKLKVVIRYPATRSKGVKLNMILRVAGRGLCGYIHPEVLKEHFMGDVDGDIIFVEFDPQMRRVAFDPEENINVPRRVRASNFSCDLSLTDVVAHASDPLEVYFGLVSKEGIGQVTNAFYRMIIVAHSEFQWEHKTRLDFLEKCGREDLLELMVTFSTEEETQEQFRWLSAMALMDSFSAFYEACFDARKDIKNLRYIRMLLDALVDPVRNPLNFDILAEFEWNGEPVDLRPIQAVYEACGGYLTASVADYPIQSLFFDGKGVTEAKKEKLYDVLILLKDEPNIAVRIWRELNNQEMTFVAP